MVRWRFLLALLAAGLMAQTQPMSVARLIGWLRNPATSRESDAAVAGFLARVKLTGRLDDSVIEVLRGQAMFGPLTVDALRKLRDQSQALPEEAPGAPAAAAQMPPAPDAAGQAAILDQVRQYALDYSRKLPDFLCLVFERRYRAPPGGWRGATFGEPEWQQVDSIAKRLSYFQQEEEEKVVEHNHANTTRDMKSLGGSQSLGDFGSILRQVFEPATAARFQWAGWTRLGSELTMVFDFSVPLERSRFVLEADGLRILTAYRGRVNVDPKTRAVLRLTVEAVDIPPEFPLRSSSDVLTYGYQTISGQPFLLPATVEVRMSVKAFQSRNVKEYQAYRKYDADSSITFVESVPTPK